MFLSRLSVLFAKCLLTPYLQHDVAPVLTPGTDTGWCKHVASDPWVEESHTMTDIFSQDPPPLHLTSQA